MIPHTIHYCWFGYHSKPRLIRKCIASWKKYLPDWEIIEWNEANYDVTQNKYIMEAYRQKKWAFVVDYARFDILNRFGGVFLDTDVELLKPIPEEILAYEAFTGFESEKTVNPGLVYSSISGQAMLERVMEVYQKREFGQKINGRPENIVDVVTGVLKKQGLQENNTFQVVNGVAVFPKEYFCCFDHETQSFEVTDQTISVHHYFASWSPWYRKLYFRCIKLASAALGKDRYLRWKRKIKKDGIKTKDPEDQNNQ